MSVLSFNHVLGLKLHLDYIYFHVKHKSLVIVCLVPLPSKIRETVLMYFPYQKSPFTWCLNHVH